ncbi:hypothetical protein RLG71_11100, partial [Streptococcus pneumoniae]|nr:hypothetical protein [Streptococcus pneumoniae]
TDSRNPADYRWTRWKGRDGANGVAGKAGADGRTSYFHIAYAASADGSREFSLEDNRQQYMGYYSDFTAADSRDRTKYKWFDRLANVQVGGRNLFLNSLFKRPLKDRYSNYNLNDGTDQTQGQLQLSIDTTNRFRGAATLKIVSTFNGRESNQKVTFYIGGATRDGSLTAMSNKTVRFSFWAKSNVEGAVLRARTGYRSTGGSATLTTQWKYYSMEYIHSDPSNATAELILHLYSVATAWVAFPKVEIGTISTDFTEAPEDIEAELNQKADQKLTQQQLTALTEKAQLHDAELKAKATMEQLSDLEKAYNAFVKSNADSRKKSESDLVEAGRRIDLLTTQFGGLAELKTFIDTYMKSTNEGLIIGKNDASSTIKVSSDRISMFSAGKEVMYISQGVINIDNGIFTASIQIGRFRTEQYHLNKDVNVIRYIGG